MARWCLSWRTPIMRASAFWYLATKREAVAAARRMGDETSWDLRATKRARRAA